MSHKVLSILSPLLIAAFATPTISGASAQTLASGSSARVKLASVLPVSVSPAAALGGGALALAPRPSLLPTLVPAAPIPAIETARTLAPALRPEAGRESDVAAALDRAFDKTLRGRETGSRTTVLAAASSDAPRLEPSTRAEAPRPVSDEKKQLSEERKQLLRTGRLPAIAGSVAAAIAGGFLGSMGGTVGAVIGTGLGVIGSSLGAIAGGYIGTQVGFKVGFGKDLLGVIIALVIAAAGLFLGGIGGFFGGAALGAMAASSGGILGSVAGVVALAPVGALVAGAGTMVAEFVRHPEKYPLMWKEWRKP